MSKYPYLLWYHSIKKLSSVIFIKQIKILHIDSGRDIMRAAAYAERGIYMSYMIIFDLVIAVLGIYLVSSALQMKRTGEISGMFHSSENTEICRDKEGFINGIYRQTLIFGVISLLFGVVDAANGIFFSEGKIFDFISMAAFLLACFWFSMKLRKEKARFFDEM